MTAATATRRQVMITAWGFKRGQPARTFGQCLRDAWQHVKHQIRMAVRPAVAGFITVSSLMRRAKPSRTFAGFQSGAWGNYTDNRMGARLGR